MPLTIKGKTYYRTAEACRLAGLSKNTFLRWVREGLIADVRYRDKRGWRLFTEDEINKLSLEVNQLNVVYSSDCESANAIGEPETRYLD